MLPTAMLAVAWWAIVLVVLGVAALAIGCGGVLLLLAVFSVGTCTAPLVAKITLVSRRGSPLPGRSVRVAHRGRAPWDGKRLVTDDNGTVIFEHTLQWPALGLLALPGALVGRLPAAPLPVEVDLEVIPAAGSQSRRIVRRFRLNPRGRAGAEGAEVSELRLAQNRLDADGGDFTAVLSEHAPAEQVEGWLHLLKSPRSTGWRAELTVVLDEQEAR